MKKITNIIMLAIIVLSFAIGAYFYPQMPEQMASHWNAQGQINGYMPKFWRLFLMPIVTIVIFLLFTLIPKIDPLKSNIEKFRKYFEDFVVAITIFLMYIYALSIAQNIGMRFNMAQALIPALGILFYYIGVVIENSKRNWFMGIRTPWTLSSDVVWDKTHKIGGKLFKASGIIALLGVVLPQYAIWLMLTPIISTSLYTIVYSYFAYQKEGSAKPN